MILYLEDWLLYPSAKPNYDTKNESYLKLAGTYYATSQTVCGTSEASNSITVAPYNVYTYIKSNSFVRNNCPDNGCGTPCIGSSVIYSKTYISYIYI